jgi:hypothetical protein
MKNRLFFCASLVLAISASLLVGGCTSTGSARGAYPTLKQTRMNVDWPMTRFRNATAAGGAVTEGERQRVDSAYSDFKKAYDQAVQAAHNNLEATTPDNVKELANRVIETISAIPF